MTDTTSDVQLLEWWAGGDRAAGSELIDRHFTALHRFFANKAGAEVEDLVQQTLLACIEARGRFRGDASFKTFLFGIARNQLFEHYRRRKRQSAFEPDITSVRDLGTSPSSALARHQEHRLLAEALQRIPLDLQVVLELAYWEKLDGPELAQVLEVPLNTVYSRLRRAKDSLRHVLIGLDPAWTGRDFEAGVENALKSVAPE